jgi:hypothetical protein
MPFSALSMLVKQHQQDMTAASAAVGNIIFL